jgi:hypothetical protein
MRAALCNGGYAVLLLVRHARSCERQEEKRYKHRSQFGVHQRQFLRLDPSDLYHYAPVRSSLHSAWGRNTCSMKHLGASELNRFRRSRVDKDREHFKFGIQVVVPVRS